MVFCCLDALCGCDVGQKGRLLGKGQDRFSWDAGRCLEILPVGVTTTMRLNSFRGPTLLFGRHPMGLWHVLFQRGVEILPFLSMTPVVPAMKGNTLLIIIDTR